MRIFILALLSASIIGCMAEEKKWTNVYAGELKSPKGMVFGFYNVENLFDTIDDQYTIDEQFLPNSEKLWNSEKYTTKLNQLAKVISSMDVDLPIFLGLAEVENKNVILDLLSTEKLRGNNYDVVHEESPDQRGIDLGFIYRKEYFNYISHEAIEVRIEEEEDFFTRDILYIKGELQGEDTIHVFLNHWSSRREGAQETEYRRVRSAAILRAKIDELLAQDEMAKIIVMGDFNDYPNNISLTQTLRAKDNRKFNKGDLYNMAYGLEQDNQGTYNYKGDWGMLDQLIISRGVFKADKGVKITAKDVNVLKLKWMLYTDPVYGDEKPSKSYGGPEYYGGYSDHLPIYARFE